MTTAGRISRGKALRAIDTRHACTNGRLAREPVVGRNLCNLLLGSDGWIVAVDNRRSPTRTWAGSVHSGAAGCATTGGTAAFSRLSPKTRQWHSRPDGHRRAFLVTREHLALGVIKPRQDLRVFAEALGPLKIRVRRQCVAH